MKIFEKIVNSYWTNGKIDKKEFSEALKANPQEFKNFFDQAVQANNFEGNVRPLLNACNRHAINVMLDAGVDFSAKTGKPPQPIWVIMTADPHQSAIGLLQILQTRTDGELRQYGPVLLEKSIWGDPNKLTILGFLSEKGIVCPIQSLDRIAKVLTRRPYEENLNALLKGLENSDVEDKVAYLGKLLSKVGRIHKGAGKKVEKFGLCNAEIICSFIDVCIDKGVFLKKSFPQGTKDFQKGVKDLATFFRRPTSTMRRIEETFARMNHELERQVILQKNGIDFREAHNTPRKKSLSI